MMNVGPEKGKIIRSSLKDAIEAKAKAKNNANARKKSQDQIRKRFRFIAVELGTYCGYGSIFLSSMIKSNELSKDMNMNKTIATDIDIHIDIDVDVDFNLFTVEINPEYAAVARQMIEMAQLEDAITVLDNDLLMDGSTGDIGEHALVDKFGDNYNYDESDVDDKQMMDKTIDFLMIDHDKESYLTDLKRLESSGLITCGTIVAADNVLFAGIHDYMDYMKSRAEEGMVETCTIESTVEYSSSEQMLVDGVGEFRFVSCMCVTK